MADAEQRILDLVKRNGLVRARDVNSLGIPTIYLSRMVQNGTLERIARGLYALPDTPWSEHVSLAEVATLIPHGVLCLLSALQLHELTTQLPQSVWLALPPHARDPAMTTSKLEIVRMSEASLNAGVTMSNIDGVQVKVFDPSKTVADLFKYRSRVGLDVALEALKVYWHSEHRDLNALHQYARIDRVERVMRPHLETLAA